ncbi:MAG: hypothetical protein IKK76_01600, partial [Alphaproteobacteria bacterium]|nr:hypothetical protein [Alphaproteobacteria bacterium]
TYYSYYSEFDKSVAFLGTTKPTSFPGYTKFLRIDMNRPENTGKNKFLIGTTETYYMDVAVIGNDGAGTSQISALPMLTDAAYSCKFAGVWSNAEGKGTQYYDANGRFITGSVAADGRVGGINAYIHWTDCLDLASVCTNSGGTYENNECVCTANGTLLSNNKCVCNTSAHWTGNAATGCTCASGYGNYDDFKSECITAKEYKCRTTGGTYSSGVACTCAGDYIWAKDQTNGCVLATSDQAKCEAYKGTWSNGTCKCMTGSWYNPDTKYCVKYDGETTYDAEQGFVCINGGVFDTTISKCAYPYNYGNPGTWDYCEDGMSNTEFYKSLKADTNIKNVDGFVVIGRPLYDNGSRCGVRVTNDKGYYFIARNMYWYNDEEHYYYYPYFIYYGTSRPLDEFDMGNNKILHLRPLNGTVGTPNGYIDILITDSLDLALTRAIDNLYSYPEGKACTGYTVTDAGGNTLDDYSKYVNSTIKVPGVINGLVKWTGCTCDTKNGYVDDGAGNCVRACETDGLAAWGEGNCISKAAYNCYTSNGLAPGDDLGDVSYDAEAGKCKCASGYYVSSNLTNGATCIRANSAQAICEASTGTWSSAVSAINGTCTCPSELGVVLRNNACVCDTAQNFAEKTLTASDTTCDCKTDYDLDIDTCKPLAQIECETTRRGKYIAGECTCSASVFNDDGICVKIDGVTAWDGTKFVCINGGTFNTVTGGCGYPYTAFSSKATINNMTPTNVSNVCSGVYGTDETGATMDYINSVFDKQRDNFQLLSEAYPEMQMPTYVMTSLNTTGLVYPRSQCGILVTNSENGGMIYLVRNNTWYLEDDETMFMSSQLPSMTILGRYSEFMSNFSKVMPLMAVYPYSSYLRIYANRNDVTTVNSSESELAFVDVALLPNNNNMTSVNNNMASVATVAAQFVAPDGCTFAGISSTPAGTGTPYADATTWDSSITKMTGIGMNVAAPAYAQWNCVQLCDEDGQKTSSCKCPSSTTEVDGWCLKTATTYEKYKTCTTADDANNIIPGTWNFNSKSCECGSGNTVVNLGGTKCQCATNYKSDGNGNCVVNYCLRNYPDGDNCICPDDTTSVGGYCFTDEVKATYDLCTNPVNGPKGTWGLNWCNCGSHATFNSYNGCTCDSDAILIGGKCTCAYGAKADGSCYTYAEYSACTAATSTDPGKAPTVTTVHFQGTWNENGGCTCTATNTAYNSNTQDCRCISTATAINQDFSGCKL